MRNLSIPADAYDTERAEGRFSFPLNFNRSQSIMFAMGDATGVTSGGITDIFTVGSASESSPSCNTTDPGGLGKEVVNCILTIFHRRRFLFFNQF